MSSTFETILILDFGSQYTQLIGRRIREANVYSEIVPFNTSLEMIRSQRPKGHHPCPAVRTRFMRRVRRHAIPRLFQLGIPVLGVCYGMQLHRQRTRRSASKPATRREYGLREIEVRSSRQAFSTACARVWMSHGDRTTRSASRI